MKKVIITVFSVLLAILGCFGCSSDNKVTYKIKGHKDIVEGKLVTLKEFPAKIQRGTIVKGLDGEFVCEFHSNEQDKKTDDNSSSIDWLTDIDIWAFFKNESLVWKNKKSLYMNGRNIVNMSPDLLLSFAAFKPAGGNNIKHSIKADYFLIYPVGMKKNDVNKDKYIKPGAYKVGYDIPEGRYVFISGIQNPKSFEEIEKEIKKMMSTSKMVNADVMADTFYKGQFESKFNAYRLDKSGDFKGIGEYSQKFKGKVPLELHKNLTPYISFSQGLLCYGDSERIDKATTLQDTDPNGNSIKQSGLNNNQNTGNGQSSKNTTKTKDVLVDHWNYENVDIYISDNTISGETSGTGRYFKVIVKQIRNGNVIKSNEWRFSKYYNDSWRYKTDEMKGNTSIVMNSKIFEYCMKRLGWSYKTDGSYYQ